MPALSQSLLDPPLDFASRSFAGELGELGAVPKQKEGGHGRNAESGGQLQFSAGIDLNAFQSSSTCGFDFFDHRRDATAGRTLFREKIDQDRCLSFKDLAGEFVRGDLLHETWSGG